MSLYKDESGQAGTILFIIIGLFIMGIAYILLGSVMNGSETMNNDMLNTTQPYTQERWDMMDTIFQYWWAFPLYMVVLFIVWGIKKAIDKQSGVL